MSAKKNILCISVMLMSMSFGLVAESYRIEGPGAQVLSERGLGNCANNVCDFTQPKTFHMNGKEIASIAVMGEMVKLMGNSSADFQDNGIVHTYFADAISHALKMSEAPSSDVVSCTTEMVSFPSPMPAFHHITACMVKASLK